MKKSVFDMVVALVNGQPVADMETLRNEINAEAAHMAEKKNENRSLYEKAFEVIAHAFTVDNTPVTVGDLFTHIEADLPEDFTKGKLAYLLRTDDRFEVDRSCTPARYSLR